MSAKKGGNINITWGKKKAFNKFMKGARKWENILF
jgi:hypothetical protein